MRHRHVDAVEPFALFEIAFVGIVDLDAQRARMRLEPTYIDEDGGGVLVAQGSRRTQRSALCRDGRDERAGGTGGEYPGEKHFRHDLNSSRGYRNGKGTRLNS